MTPFTKKLKELHNLLKWKNFHLPIKKPQADLAYIALKIEGIEKTKKKNKRRQYMRIQRRVIA